MYKYRTYASDSRVRPTHAREHVFVFDHVITVRLYAQNAFFGPADSLAHPLRICPRPKTFRFGTLLG
jgi:hypothetical protein